jgi:hypothetical protein
LPRELFDTRRHLRGRAIEAARQSDDDRAEAVFFCRKARNLRHDDVHRINVETRWTQQAEWPCERSRRIAHRDTNASFADIKPHESHRVTLY